jgi:hypothetical protein
MPMPENAAQLAAEAGTARLRPAGRAGSLESKSHGVTRRAFARLTCGAPRAAPASARGPWPCSLASDPLARPREKTTAKARRPMPRPATRAAIRWRFRCVAFLNLVHQWNLPPLLCVINSDDLEGAPRYESRASSSPFSAAGPKGVPFHCLHNAYVVQLKAR